MAKKENLAEKYLTTKRSSTWNIVFAALLAVGVILFFIRWIYYGIILMLVAAIGFVVISATKVKDEDYEEQLRLIIRDNNIELTSDVREELYDIGRGPITLSKDKKPKSRFWVMTEFFFKGSECRVVKYEVDIVDSKVEEESFKVAIPCAVRTEETEVTLPTGKKKMFYLMLGDNEVRIPVDGNSSDTDELIKKLTEESHR